MLRAAAVSMAVVVASGMLTTSTAWAGFRQFNVDTLEQQPWDGVWADFTPTWEGEVVEVEIGSDSSGPRGKWPPFGVGSIFDLVGSPDFSWQYETSSYQFGDVSFEKSYDPVGPATALTDEHVRRFTETEADYVPQHPPHRADYGFERTWNGVDSVFSSVNLMPANQSAALSEAIAEGRAEEMDDARAKLQGRSFASNSILTGLGSTSARSSAEGSASGSWTVSHPARLSMTVDLARFGDSDVSVQLIERDASDVETVVLDIDPGRMDVAEDAQYRTVLSGVLNPGQYVLRARSASDGEIDSSGNVEPSGLSSFGVDVEFEALELYQQRVSYEAERYNVRVHELDAGEEGLLIPAGRLDVPLLRDSTKSQGTDSNIEDWLLDQLADGEFDPATASADQIGEPYYLSFDEETTVSIERQFLDVVSGSVTDETRWYVKDGHAYRLWNPAGVDLSGLSLFDASGPLAPTPEPGSVVVLAAGALAGLGRRRGRS
jgi:hypothetical protein